jgi:cyclopropane fatty-acyl-phospholipid synthase-like methyltransferase
MQSYREYVGWPEGWDVLSAMQFSLLTFLGLRENQNVLDIGCGSLRTGRLLIPYLLPGHYFGIEPQKWLIEEGIKNECGADLIKIKKPIFSYDSNFTCTAFGKQFDYIFAHSIFTHSSQQQIKRCLSEVKQCMKADSIFSATFMKGESNYSGEKWVYPECITYTLEYMTQIINESGLKCQTIEWYHRNQTLILITLPEFQFNLPNIFPNAEKVESMIHDLTYYKDAFMQL